MVTRYIDVDGYWGIIFVYDFNILDAEEMAAIMDSFGLSEHEIPKAIRTLLGVNTGMAISRHDLTMSVVFVSEASSLDQFLDTCAHEVDHVQAAILEHYNIPQGGEDGAWLQGYIMRKITRILQNDKLF